MSEVKHDPLEKAQELFDFLQGRLPDGYKIPRKERPKLTADQAWTVIWYLGNKYWQVPDFIERCDLCGELYNGHQEGACLDYGGLPYFFCEQCRDDEQFEKKMRRNPDKQAREDYFAK